ncbi:MAG: long-chain fatty acid--CoA ligase [Thermodesulfobacteriota bacterium]
MESRPWHRHYDPWVPTTMRYPRIKIQDFLNSAANIAPDKPALDFYGSRLTFREVRRQSLRMANALASLGIKKGDRIALHLPNCPQYVIAYYAALNLGAIVVNVNPLYTLPELKHVLELTDPRALFTFDLVLGNVRKLGLERGAIHVVVTRVTDYIEVMPKSTPQELDLEEGWHHFAQLLDSSSDVRVPRVEIASEDPAVIMFTGGTTGTPKGAVLTHANYVAANFQLAAWGGNVAPLIMPAQQRVVVSVMPFFHVYGQICCLNWCMTNFGMMILVPRFDIDEFLGLMANFKEITWFPAVPTLLSAVVNHPKAAEIELDARIQIVNSGAAPMPVELIGRVQDLGVTYTEGWGMTETTSLGVGNPLAGMKKTGSIGIPFIDVDVRLVDVDKGVEEVAPGQSGEIILKSPCVMKEYWNNPKETADHIKDGWLHTGDIAVQDEDGYLFIVDRKKDMIIAGGYNIFPREIDEVLYQHPKVRDAVAVGVADEYRGETVKAFVVLKEGETATEEEIISFCRESLAAYKAPKIVEFRKELPRSAVGKILRKVLREEELAKKKVEKP